MHSIRPKTDPNLAGAIAAATLAIFVADWLLPLGIAVWVLYLAPIALSKFSWRSAAPLLVALVCSLLVAAGFALSTGRESDAAHYAPINRSFGVVTMWITAILGRRFIRTRLELVRQQWLQSAQTGLSTKMEGEQSHAQLGEGVLTFLAEYLGAQVGAIYLSAADGAQQRFASYALDPTGSGPEVVRAGQGLVGQVMRDKRVIQISDVPEGYLDVRSGVGRCQPKHLVLAPALADGHVHAVIELGFIEPIESAQLDLLASVSGSVAAAVRSVNHRKRQAELLEETQSQAEELQTQQEELKVQNEELEQQAQVLQHSQVQLENQQSELEQINSQLAQQAESLERQRDHLTSTQGELKRSNEYKSEFLANMSHELRTPLNSSLILAKLLMDNRDRNLNAEQVNFAKTIYSAGNDLLTLINDILDLSKIEAGKLDVRPEAVAVGSLLDALKSTFQPIANDRGLQLTMTLDPDVPSTIRTDATRIQQILKNLLSNALKFTEKGAVSLRVSLAVDSRVAFAVTDTGIGIASEQHEVIFEAFRQADGTTHRKYGGTGLGLSISRDLARLLGGELELDSAPGRGSTFTLLLPKRHATNDAAPEKVHDVRHLGSAPNHAAPRATTLNEPFPDDDREGVSLGARSILVIEDDAAFSRILQDLARELDFKVLLAQNGESGLALAERFRPSAIVLDVGLPDRSGLSVLDALKQSPTTRHIPVHVVSAADHTQAALAMGAAGYAIKPVKRDELVLALQRLEQKFTQKLRRVLVVEDDVVHRDSTCQLVAGQDVVSVGVGTAAEALEQLRTTTFDCMVLDLTLPDRTGFELLEEMAESGQYAFPPVIVYTGRSLSREDEQKLRRFSNSIIVKGARSPERLLDEVTLFLHQIESELPPDRQRMLSEARHRESVFAGRRILIVEDDVRNIFALSSVLEPKGAKVEIARNGREAVTRLARQPAVDLVLMDIMMPEMDGLQAMQEIRKQAQHAKLPIIALTAKAMSDDRVNCLRAGANDYIAKPLDVDKLLSLARVWMPK